MKWHSASWLTDQGSNGSRIGPLVLSPRRALARRYYRRFKGAHAGWPRPGLPRRHISESGRFAAASDAHGMAPRSRRRGFISEGVAASEPLLRRAVTNLGPEDAERLATELKELANFVTALMKDGWPWSLVELQRADAATLQRSGRQHSRSLPKRPKSSNGALSLSPDPSRYLRACHPGLSASQIFQSYASGKNPFGYSLFGRRPIRPSSPRSGWPGLPQRRPTTGNTLTLPALCREGYESRPRDGFRCEPSLRFRTLWTSATNALLRST